jgi:hypothetical protein
MAFLLPVWRSFRDIPADAEAAFASSSCTFSLATLEVACTPGIGGFALTERKQADMWRWAIVSVEGPIVDEGWEPTQACARTSAMESMLHGMSR